MDSYKLLVDGIGQIQNNNLKEQAIEELFNCESFSTLFASSNDTIVKLLEFIFQDESEWIQYWLWELDFGKEATRLGAFDANNEPIPLSTVNDLYNLLLKNMP